MNEELPVGGRQSSVGRRDASRRVSPVAPLRSPLSGFRSLRGFSLIEMLIVVALIAILSALVAPSLQGLLGVSGSRGGVNSLASVLDQARLAAMQNGVETHVGMPLSLDNDTGYSSVIVFREKRPDVAENALVPMSRWIKLPRGVFMEKGDNFDTVATTKTIASGILPKLVGVDGKQIEPTSLNVITFDRFGKLANAGSPVSVKVGEKPSYDAGWQRNSSNYFELVVQPLTGRTTVIDRRGSAQ